jgi:hypothetical protein
MTNRRALAQPSASVIDAAKRMIQKEKGPLSVVACATSAGSSGM